MPKKTVLLAEDCSDTRELYCFYLVSHGWRVVEAAHGGQVVGLVAEHRPDVIVIDLSMPVVDGWELTRRLKADPETAHVPVIALTGHVLPHERDRAVTAGCDSFLAKPCLPEALERELLRLLATGGVSTPA